MMLGRFRKRRYSLLVIIAIMLMGLRVYPKPALKDLIPHSTAIYAQDGTLLRLTLATDGQYQLWADYKDINPQAIQAVKLYEDRFYDWHWGVNPIALLRGTWRSFAGAEFSGTPRQGASTITMQLARSLYGIDSRTITGKLKQIGAAIWLECRYSKREIMQAYLNIAPYGGNIKGISTASLVYFNKPASRLNLPEVITLAVIPQNPNKRLKLSSQNTTLNDARRRLWRDWLMANPKDVSYKADMALPVKPLFAKNLPFIAPHFTDAILSSKPQQAAIHTALNTQAQATLERMIAAYIKNNRSLGINNATALLLDAKTMHVKALVATMS